MNNNHLTLEASFTPDSKYIMSGGSLCVCVRVCMRVCMCMHTCVCVRGNDVDSCTHMHAHTHTHTHAHAHAHICTHAQAHRMGLSMCGQVRRVKRSQY